MAPLLKRIPREFKNNLGRYIGMLALLIVAISITSGFLMAAFSMMKIIDGMREKYQMDDAYVTTTFKLSDEARQAVEEMGVSVYDQFYRDIPSTLPATAAVPNREVKIRVYQAGREVDTGEYAQGREPQAPNEIALHRVFCSNNNLHVGDTITVDGAPMELVGIMVLSDNTTTFENNSDFMFNATVFTVGEVTPEAFETLTKDGKIFRYALVFDDREMDLVNRMDFEEEILEVLDEHDAMVTDFADHESNSGMTFAPEDVYGDSAMWEALLMALIVIMAFVFVVLTDANIEEESAVIGTLLASGYRKREIIAHYMTLPVLVGLVGCGTGFGLGVKYMTSPMQGLYYNSYGFPHFELSWDWHVFLITTLVPFVLLVVISFFGIARKMGATPLQFLRHEISHRSRRGNAQLPESWPFPLRFRVRVFLRNISHFVTLYFGIVFGSFLLLMGLCLLPTMKYFATQTKESLPAERLYLLKAPLELEGTREEREAWAAAERLTEIEGVSELSDELAQGNVAFVLSTLMSSDFDGLELHELTRLLSQAQSIDEDAHPVNTQVNSDKIIAQAEPFVAASLQVDRRFNASKEEMTLYGIQANSRYWQDMTLEAGKVVVGAGLAEKCGLAVGKTYSFYNKYKGVSYELEVSSIYGNAANTNAYMLIEDVNELLGNEPDSNGKPYFNGYVSDGELAIDNLYLASVVTPADMSRVADQMEDSMGTIMNYMKYMTIPLFFILIYLLTKTVIDRSARPISYMKVFGYHNLEINTLYIRAITITVVLSCILCLPVLLASVDIFIKLMLARFNGNIEAYLPASLLAQEVGIQIATYAVVALFHIHQIRKVSLAEALKVQE